MFRMFVIAILVICQSLCASSSDITNAVFRANVDNLPVAFGDFNSDELTDLFVVSPDSHSVEILLAHEEEPLLRSQESRALRCRYPNSRITSVVPGDFDGDAFMDVMITTLPDDDDAVVKTKDLNLVHIIWGGGTYLNCSSEQPPLLRVSGQPLALDYNQDMVIDLFGEDIHGNCVFWVFDNSRSPPKRIVMSDGHHPAKLSDPHAHAFIDLNSDFMADLFITTVNGFEIWFGNETSPNKFVYGSSIELPPEARFVGQSLFMDVELKGRMDMVTPVCLDTKCASSALMVYTNGAWHNLHVQFQDNSGQVWRFFKHPGIKYGQTITLRSGDFNLDGYPDLLATLALTGHTHGRSVLLENVECKSVCGDFNRTFQIKWDILGSFSNNSVMAAFFDFYQDGILDVIVVMRNPTDDRLKVGAFKNSLDYDANFLKVMVLTGLGNKNSPMTMGRVGKKKRTYGTNLPGPYITYRTTTQKGNERIGACAQLPQSAFNTLGLPYTILGLDRTPNFVDSLTVGLSNHSRTWMQIIPNSQLLVIPWPTNEPSHWKAQLFVTPSKLILMSVTALTGICGFITLVIGVLHWKERQEDKKERMSESHRFHFDAM